MRAEGELKDGEATGPMADPVRSALEQTDMKCQSGQEHRVVRNLHCSPRMWLYVMKIVSS